MIYIYINIYIFNEPVNQLVVYIYIYIYIGREMTAIIVWRREGEKK